MPLLYGEGNNAFTRLQLEIMRVSNDQSLFAWVREGAIDYDLTGLLADSPAAFQFSGAIESTRSSSPFSMTNLGLRITLPLVQKSNSNAAIRVLIDGRPPYNQCVAFLNCYTRSSTPSKSSTTERVFLRLIQPEADQNVYYRLFTNKLLHIPEHDLPPQQMEEIYVPQVTDVFPKMNKMKNPPELEIRMGKVIMDRFVVSETRSIVKKNSRLTRRDLINPLADQGDGRYLYQTRPKSGLLVYFESSQQHQSFVLEITLKCSL